MVSGGGRIAISDVTVVKYLEHADEKNTTVANASVNRK